MSREVVSRLFGVEPAQINESMLEWAWKQRAGGTAQKLVLVILCMLADEYGTVTISRRDLQTLTCIRGKKTLNAAINALTYLGFLCVHNDCYCIVAPSEQMLDEGEKLSLHVSRETREAIFAMDEWTCRACGSEDNLQIDHIMPQSRGGFHDIDNLQTLCGPCNLSKGDLTQDEWDAAKGRPQ